MGLGGYDHGYEIYYRGTPIGRVNYGDKEYELYVDDFITRETLPEFLAAIDARKFKNVHEKDMGPYKEGEWVSWHDQEWAIDDGWYDEDEKQYFYTIMQLNGHKMDAIPEEELTPLDGDEPSSNTVNESMSLKDITKRYSAEQRTALDGKSWWVAFDNETGKYIPGCRKFNTKRECENGIIIDMKHGRLDATPDELDSIEAAFSGMRTESTRKQKMKFRKFVKESIENLESFLSEKEKEFKPSKVNPSWDDSEDKIWAVQDYLSSMGEFTDEDREFLKQTDPELLSLEEYDEQTGDETSNPDFKPLDQAMWEIGRTSNGKKKNESFADEEFDYESYGRDIANDFVEGDPDELDADGNPQNPEHFYHGKYDQGPIPTTHGEEVEFYTRIGKEWANANGMLKESTRKQKMKFRKIVKEGTADIKNIINDYGDACVQYGKSGDRIDKIWMQRQLDKVYQALDCYGESTKKVVKEADGDVDMGEPKIYVGTYAKYNNGSIDGKWITISDYNTYEEFVDACRELHKDEKDPEFMVQDYENFPEKWYHEGGLPTEEEFDKINEYYMMDDDRKGAYEAFVNYTGLDSMEDFEEAYEGKFDSAEDFAYNMVENLGWEGIGSDNLEMYFDYDSFGRDLMYDFHIGDPDNTDSEGEPEDPDHYYDNEGYDQGEYESDRQVAEDYVDSLGGVEQLGSNAQNYFDYAAFGRDLLINDYFEEDGYVFRHI